MADSSALVIETKKAPATPVRSNRSELDGTVERTFQAVMQKYFGPTIDSPFALGETASELVGPIKANPAAGRAFDAYRSGIGTDEMRRHLRAIDFFEKHADVIPLETKGRVMEALVERAQAEVVTDREAKAWQKAIEIYRKLGIALEQRSPSTITPEEEKQLTAMMKFFTDRDNTALTIRQNNGVTSLDFSYAGISTATRSAITLTDKAETLPDGSILLGRAERSRVSEARRMTIAVDIDDPSPSSRRKLIDTLLHEDVHRLGGTEFNARDRGHAKSVEDKDKILRRITQSGYSADEITAAVLSAYPDAVAQISDTVPQIISDRIPGGELYKGWVAEALDRANRSLTAAETSGASTKSLQELRTRKDHLRELAQTHIMGVGIFQDDSPTRAYLYDNFTQHVHEISRALILARSRPAQKTDSN